MRLPAAKLALDHADKTVAFGTVMQIASSFMIGSGGALLLWGILLVSSRKKANRQSDMNWDSEPSPEDHDFGPRSARSDRSRREGTRDSVRWVCPYCGAETESFIEGIQVQIQCSGCNALFELGGAAHESRRGRKQKQRQKSSPESTRESDPVTKALETLELSAGATSDQIQAAFQRLRSEYHPDKTARLGKALRDLAEVKAKEINAAKDLLEREGLLVRRK